MILRSNYSHLYCRWELGASYYSVDFTRAPCGGGARYSLLVAVLGLTWLSLSTSNEITCPSYLCLGS